MRLARYWKCILSCIFRKRSIKFPIIASSRKLNTMDFGVTRTNGLSPFSSTLNRKSPRGSHWKRSLLSTRSSLTNSEVIPSISDHEAIYIEASLCLHKTPTQSRTVSLYKKADFEAIREGLCTFYSEMPDPNTVTTDELWSSFKGRSQFLIIKHVPTKVYKGHKTHKP